MGEEKYYFFGSLVSYIQDDDAVPFASGLMFTVFPTSQHVAGEYLLVSRKNILQTCGIIKKKKGARNPSIIPSSSNYSCG